MGGIPSCPGPGGVPAPPGALDEMNLVTHSAEGRKLAPARANKSACGGFSEAVWYPLVVPAGQIGARQTDPGKQKAAATSGSCYGSDGTRTRDLRRDRGALSAHIGR